jgi:hypothetical protein
METPTNQPQLYNRPSSTPKAPPAIATQLGQTRASPAGWRHECAPPPSVAPPGEHSTAQNRHTPILSTDSVTTGYDVLSTDGSCITQPSPLSCYSCRPDPHAHPLTSLSASSSYSTTKPPTSRQGPLHMPARKLHAYRRATHIRAHTHTHTHTFAHSHDRATCRHQRGRERHIFSCSSLTGRLDRGVGVHTRPGRCHSVSPTAAVLLDSLGGRVLRRHHDVEHVADQRVLQHLVRARGGRERGRRVHLVGITPSGGRGVG